MKLKINGDWVDVDYWSFLKCFILSYIGLSIGIFFILLLINLVIGGIF